MVRRPWCAAVVHEPIRHDIRSVHDGHQDSLSASTDDRLPRRVPTSRRWIAPVPLLRWCAVWSAWGSTVRSTVRSAWGSTVWSAWGSSVRCPWGSTVWSAWGSTIARSTHPGVRPAVVRSTVVRSTAWRHGATSSVLHVGRNSGGEIRRWLLLARVGQAPRHLEVLPPSRVGELARGSVDAPNVPEVHKSTKKKRKEARTGAR